RPRAARDRVVVDPDDRHRRGVALRRSGARHARHARHLHEVQAALRASLRRPRHADGGRVHALSGRREAAEVSERRRKLLIEARTTAHGAPPSGTGITTWTLPAYRRRLFGLELDLTIVRQRDRPDEPERTA